MAKVGGAAEDRLASQSLRVLWKRLFKRSLTLIIAICIALLSVLVIPFGDIHNDVSALSRFAIGVLLGAAVAVRWYISHRDRATEKDITRVNCRKEDMPARSSEEARIKAATSAFADVLSTVDVLRFFEVFNNPATYVSRIAERVELGDETYRVKVTRTVLGAENNNVTRQLIPILSPRKNELIDKLKVTCKKELVRTLSYQETHGALLVIGEALLETVFGNVPDDLWGKLRLQIINEQPTDPGERVAIADLLKEKIEAANLTGDDVVWRDVLHNFVYGIQSTFPIIALAPSGSAIKLEIEYTETRERLEEKKIGGVRKLSELTYSHIRAAFGLARRSHIIPLTRATKARSYHFRTDAPEGMYVYYIEIGLATLQEANQTERAAIAISKRPMDPRWDAADTRGLTYVHAYGRDLDIANTASRIPYLIIELREKPPGLMFVVALLSVYLMVLTLGVGNWYDDIFSPNASQFWPTILFGVPAIVSGWLVSRFTTDAVSRLSISTLAVSSWFIVNAVVAMTIAALGLAKIITTSSWWEALIVSVTACASMAVMLVVLRARRYQRRVSGAIRK
ncbi:hypothetical protein H0264_35695 [Nocardia huaxiensis]|uniref:Uncharacterized protein n=1 Tax=Nocardia huaxiensis TaxID=2755382 RepID=A0A7D6Z9L7_9NOCA|nr:hypothetical protein [Nocardia huaxiensis]QLY30408.1 hypothetical protein H0264_35695 [Nocardia huaxiensis]